LYYQLKVLVFTSREVNWSIMVLSDLLPAEILTIIDAISTAVLAVITYYYAKETGLIRKRGQHPSFSLEPALYRTSNSNSAPEAYKLSLTNNGLPATDIRVDCSWGRQHPSNNLILLRSSILCL
jgi:hypothetical protein